MNKSKDDFSSLGMEEEPAVGPVSTSDLTQSSQARSQLDALIKQHWDQLTPNQVRLATEYYDDKLSEAQIEKLISDLLGHFS